MGQKPTQSSSRRRKEGRRGPKEESPRFPIRVAAQRTGLKPNLIRAWERRYDAIQPQRSAGGQRLYSESDIERLLLLSRLTDGGHSIGQIAGLSTRRLVRLLHQQQPPSDARVEAEPEAAAPKDDDPRIRHCLEAVQHLDGRELLYRLEGALVDLGARGTLAQVVVPLMRRIGDLWSRNLLRPMHEQLATGTVRTFIHQLIQRQRPAPGAPMLVAAALRGQRHELGALLAAAMAATEDWRVLPLGADLPAEDLVAAAREMGAAAVALSLIYPADDPQLGHELLHLRQQLGPEVALLVGGRCAVAYRSFLETARAVQVEDLAELPTVLADLRRHIGGPSRRRRLPHGAPLAGSRLGSRATSLALSHGSPGAGSGAWRSRRQVFVSAEARQRLGLDSTQISTDGGLLLEDLPAVRSLALDLRRRTAADPLAEPSTPPPPSAGDLYALGLLHEFYQDLLAGYRARRNPQVLARALSWLQEGFGRGTVDRMLRRTAALFPTARGGVGSADQPDTEKAHIAAEDPEFLLHKALILWLLNENPAARGGRLLFDDEQLEAETGYRRLMAHLGHFFDGEAGYGAGDESVFGLLRVPAGMAPDSLAAQLEHVLALERRVAGERRDRLETGLDVLREEHRPLFAPNPTPGPAPGLGVGAATPPEPGRAYQELRGTPRRYGRCRPWMRELVLVAKHVDVWLHQLSAGTAGAQTSPGRTLERLDQIPDAALDDLAAQGFTGLWLLGVWRRSEASRRIKRAAGDARAEASAYAVDEYRVAEHLGGDGALEDLRRRAAARGLRLGADFVPNHMALDSRWVLERPELFRSREDNPYPNYTFTGPDLSPDPAVGLFVEDHYRDRSDAAVVFQRLDRESGEVRYLYHGNDGTGLPWNDTAQLDHLRAETRQALIDALVAVARQFPVVRVDAAMALVRRHILRLWYPSPGQGGAIPSRADHGLTEAQLEQAMPRELWLEAMERLQEEAPDTLLVAEGFWLMEAYLARNLGLHRVYHSSFMHHLLEGDNEAFRRSLLEALDFDRRLPECFTNYLTNPDEEPAVVRLGKGDRYFALATLLATLPGLPLFGHGQTEGLVERYGMDYRRARFDEDPDPRFLARHRAQIAPLLRLRSLFAGSRHLHLLDFHPAPQKTPEGSGPKENEPEKPEALDCVLAFCNRPKADDGLKTSAALVVVNHDARRVIGSLHRVARLRPSASPAESDDSGGTSGNSGPEDLLATLEIEAAPRRWLLVHDPRTNAAELWSTEALARRGLDLTLEPFATRVWIGFELLDDPDGELATLADDLHGEPLEIWRRRLGDLGHLQSTGTGHG
ncbi:MAG: MerR family transcriptional regulator [Acidobacteriota bacterium]|nr:MerR family transcriptional regulator [Acidobacteriota bacterium]